VLYAVMQAVAALARLLPRRLSLLLAKAFANAVYGLYLLSPYRSFIPGNVRKALDEKGEKIFSPSQSRRIARLSIVNLVKGITEVMRFPARETGRIVSFEGLQHLEEVLAEGRGAIAVSAHFGNWELLGAAISEHGHPLSVLVQPPSKSAFERLVIEFRASAGVKTLANHGVASLRPVFKALGRNEVVGLICDQHGENLDAFGRLFGHPVSVPASPYSLSKKTGAAILPMFIFRQKGERHLLRISPPLEADSPDDFAQKLCRHFETAILAQPEQWLWAHDRWAREKEFS
jgi:KDO2-lipid IV(A) lauroyltransferase